MATGMENIEPAAVEKEVGKGSLAVFGIFAFLGIGAFFAVFVFMMVTAFTGNDLRAKANNRIIPGTRGAFPLGQYIFFGRLPDGIHCAQIRYLLGYNRSEKAYIRGCCSRWRAGEKYFRTMRFVGKIFSEALSRGLETLFCVRP